MNRRAAQAESTEAGTAEAEEARAEAAEGLVEAAPAVETAAAAETGVVAWVEAGKVAAGSVLEAVGKEAPVDAVAETEEARATRSGSCSRGLRCRRTPRKTNLGNCHS